MEVGRDRAKPLTVRGYCAVTSSARPFARIPIGEAREHVVWLDEVGSGCRDSLSLTASSFSPIAQHRLSRSTAGTSGSITSKSPRFADVLSRRRSAIAGGNREETSRARGRHHRGQEIRDERCRSGTRPPAKKSIRARSPNRFAKHGKVDQDPCPPQAAPAALVSAKRSYQRLRLTAVSVGFNWLDRRACLIVLVNGKGAGR